MRMFFQFKRNGLKVSQTALGIEFEIDHARKEGRRIFKRDDTRSEGVVPEAVGTQFAGALAIPVEERGRPLGKHAIPLGGH